MREYETAVAKVVERLSKYDEIAALYQFGSVGVPGISDIDMIVVFRDDTKSFTHGYWSRLNELERNLFMHGVYGMPQSVFQARQRLIPMSELQLLDGDAIPETEVLSDEMMEAGRILYAIEYLFVNLFNLSNQLLSRRVKIRSLLCSLHSLRHDFLLLNPDDVDADQTTVMQVVDGIRAAFRDGRDIDSAGLGGLIPMVVDVILATISRCAQNKRIRPGEGALDYLHVGVNNYIVKSLSDNQQVELIMMQERVGRLLRWCDDQMQDNWWPRRLTGLGQVFSASVVIVPSAVLSVLQGECGGLLEEAYRERHAVLERYAAFMKRVPKEYAMFDVFRWHTVRSKKWNAIRGANWLLAGNRYAGIRSSARAALRR